MAESTSDLVKITIRLPRRIVTHAKLHAIALDYDLQDLVARVLREYLEREPMPASLAVMWKRRGQKKGGK